MIWDGFFWWYGHNGPGLVVRKSFFAILVSGANFVNFDFWPDLMGLAGFWDHLETIEPVPRENGTFFANFKFWKNFFEVIFGDFWPSQMIL